MDNKQEFSWFLDGKSCCDIFNSIESTIENAQKEYDNGCLNNDIINIGIVYRFDVKNIVKQVADNIEDNIFDQVDEFCFGCNIEPEVYVPEADREEFNDKVTTVLFPIIEKYMFINPKWICTPILKYDLKDKIFIKLK